MTAPELAGQVVCDCCDREPATLVVTWVEQTARFRVCVDCLPEDPDGVVVEPLTSVVPTLVAVEDR